jgi:PAS domain S-box-containing protein
MSVFTSKNAGGLMSRRLLPALLALPLIIGWLRLYGERTGFFNSEVGVVLVAITYSVCFVILTWISARSVNKSDEKKRNYQAQLFDREIKFRSIFENSNDAIVLLDVESGKYIECNEITCKISGYTKEEIFKMKTGGFLSAPHKDEIISNMEILKKTGMLRRESELKTKDGSLIPIEFNASLLKIDNTQCLVSFIRDITERKKFENELERKNAKLIEINATKDKFFKIIAHDMKNPFISLLGASELLYENANKYSPEKITTLTKVLYDSAKNGFDMLLNLLEWSRSQAGSMIFQPETINLKDMVNKDISTLVEYAARRKLI